MAQQSPQATIRVAQTTAKKWQVTGSERVGFLVIVLPVQNLRVNRRAIRTISIPLRRSLSASLSTLLSLVVASVPASATEHHFTYTYEVTTTGKGELELENWVTWQFHRGRGGEPNTNESAFRHEFEYGITDRLQASLYFADWHMNDHPGGGDRVHYDDAALEVIYRLSDPVTNFLGSLFIVRFAAAQGFANWKTRFFYGKISGSGSRLTMAR